MTELANRAAAARRAMEPAWNDLREQRVLGRVQASVRAGGGSRRRGAMAMSLVAATLAVAAAFFLVIRNRNAGSFTSPLTTAFVHAPPKIALVDGSEATLSPDARVKIDEQRDDHVQLTQSAGHVQYEVKHEPKRRFVVRVGDVAVRVRGTGFTVTLAGDKVKVHVIHGKVEVAHAGQDKAVELVTGESIEVAAYHKTLVQPGEPEPIKPIETKPAPKVEVVTVESLLAKADEARAGKRWEEAATALRTLVAQFPKDPRVASALFTLGRVERGRGRHAAAAEAFGRCHKMAPHGSLAEDALAEEAASWKSAGDPARARAAAKRYLDLHPSGAHAARMLPLVE